MTRRILVLTRFHLRTLLFSLSGLLYVLLALVFYQIPFKGQLKRGIGFP